MSHITLLLSLLASTIDHKIDRCLELLPVEDKIWKDAMALADSHGVSGLMFSAVEMLPKPLMPNIYTLLEIMGPSSHQKIVYQKQFDTASMFATSLKKKAVEMKILKGIAFSTYYDTPYLRECGDCDCYLCLSDNKKKYKSGASGFEIGNKTIEEIGGRGEFGTYKHSHLFLNGMMLENHHYITDFNGTKHGKTVEILLEKALTNSPGTQISKSDMIRPNAHFNALLLIRHAQGNFMNGGITLRMIYDWAVLLRAEQNNIDWDKLYADFDTCKLHLFADIMTSLCVKYLGLKLTRTNISICNDNKLVDDILSDTIARKYVLEEKETLMHKTKRILLRFARMWKYRNLATESYATMIWNSFAFSSYMKRDISLD